MVEKQPSESLRTLDEILQAGKDRLEESHLLTEQVDEQLRKGSAAVETTPTP